MVDPPTRSTLSLRGLSKVVADFFEYLINSILYQRGIYPPEDFMTVRKYGLSMVLTQDEDVRAYTKRIMTPLHKWIHKGTIDRLVVAIVDKDEAEVVERWEFRVVVDRAAEEPAVPASQIPPEVTQQIQAIVRQITASVTFLPILQEGNYTFNVLVYADPSAPVPAEWADSANGSMDVQGDRVELVEFRQFLTGPHRVGGEVQYRLG